MILFAMYPLCLYESSAESNTNTIQRFKSKYAYLTPILEGPFFTASV
jgi:hypothetical protein